MCTFDKLHTSAPSRYTWIRLRHPASVDWYRFGKWCTFQSKSQTPNQRTMNIPTTKLRTHDLLRVASRLSTSQINSWNLLLGLLSLGGALCVCAANKIRSWRLPVMRLSIQMPSRPHKAPTTRKWTRSESAIVVVVRSVWWAEVPTKPARKKEKKGKKREILILSSFRSPFIGIHIVVWVFSSFSLSPPGRVQIKLSRTKRNYSRYSKMRWSRKPRRQMKNEEKSKINVDRARPVPDATRMAHFHFHIF